MKVIQLNWVRHQSRSKTAEVRDTWLWRQSSWTEGNASFEPLVLHYQILEFADISAALQNWHRWSIWAEFEELVKSLSLSCVARLLQMFQWVPHWSAWQILLRSSCASFFWAWAWMRPASCFAIWFSSCGSSRSLSCNAAMCQFILRSTLAEGLKKMILLL